MRGMNFSTDLNTLREGSLRRFLSKATGTAVNWVKMAGMKIPIYCGGQSEKMRGMNFSTDLNILREGNLRRFLSKATGIAVNWVKMAGMKISIHSRGQFEKLSFESYRKCCQFGEDSRDEDSVGILAISETCSGVAARACSLVNMDATKIVEIMAALKCLPFPR